MAPTVKYEKRRRQQHEDTSHTDESKALRNWQLRMMERKKQQGHISSKIIYHFDFSSRKKGLCRPSSCSCFDHSLVSGRSPLSAVTRLTRDRGTVMLVMVYHSSLMKLKIYCGLKDF